MFSDRIIRHPNGGAQKIGSEVHLSRSTRADGGTIISGNSNVFDSNIEGSDLANCQAFLSYLLLTTAVSSAFAYSVVSYSTLKDCVVHEATVRSVVLEEVVVEGAKLYGPWALKGNARIPTGSWYRPPRFRRITGENGVDIGLTESTEGHALMACWRKPLKTWLKAGPRLGVKHRWTEAQIQSAREFFTELLDVPMHGSFPLEGTK